MSTTTTLSRTAAIRAAKNEVGDLYYVGCGPQGWGYNTWSHQHDAWWTPSSGSTWEKARQDRAEDIACRAARLMLESRGWSREDAGAAVLCAGYLWPGYQWPGIESAVDQMVAAAQ